MNHLQAAEKLTRFAEESLGEAERRELEVHLGSCAECRDWLETQRALAAVLEPAAPERPAPVHLTSEDLCAFALAEETLDEVTRQRCARHLWDCLECEEEVGLVRAATAAGRGEPAPEAVPAVRGGDESRDGRWLPRIAVAAGLVLAVAVGFLWRGASPVSADRQLSEASLTEQTTVRASGSILVETTRVETGGDLTLESGNTVAFGDGFRIDSGGSLAVVLEQPQDSSSRTKKNGNANEKQT